MAVAGASACESSIARTTPSPRTLSARASEAAGTSASMAAREYAVRIESLERLGRGEPLWCVHEAVFVVLALESEPVDPRL